MSRGDRGPGDCVPTGSGRTGSNQPGAVGATQPRGAT